MPASGRILLAACVIAATPLATTAYAAGNPHTTCRHVAQTQSGRAMFYGQKFDGRTMANGQVFDSNAMTGASRTLPLGTRARVTNLQTHASTVIVITDRGALRARNVIVDLSAGAARAIGLTEHEGVAPVTIVPVAVPAVSVVSVSTAASRVPPAGCI